MWSSAGFSATFRIESSGSTAIKISGKISGEISGKVQKQLQELNLTVAKKIIVVPNRLINVVL